MKIEPKGAKREPKGAKMKPKATKREPKEAKGSQKGDKREPRGPKRVPKGSQREPKASQREPKASQRRAKGRQKCIKHRCPKKDTKKGGSSIYLLVDFWPIWWAENLEKYWKTNTFLVFSWFLENFKKHWKKGRLRARFLVIFGSIFNFRGSQNPPFRASAIAGYLQIHLPNEIT